jgi:hypothetical protein
MNTTFYVPKRPLLKSMKSATDYKVQNNLAIILVGNPKVGKTRVAAAFPDPWILDLDKNLGSVIPLLNGKQVFFDQADVDDDGKPVPQVAQWDRVVKLIETAIANPKVKTIAIDSLTRLGELIEAHIIAKLKVMGVKLRADTVDEQIRLADYDTYATFLLRAVALCRASGKFVLWTAHQRLIEEELTKQARMRFSIAGKLKDTLGGYFTDVYGMDAETKMVMVGSVAKEQTKYTIRTKPATGNKFVPLGTSLPSLETEIDITDKTPTQIWEILGPKLSNAALPVKS